jgi:hypothetical protein
MSDNNITPTGGAPSLFDIRYTKDIVKEGAKVVTHLNSLRKSNSPLATSQTTRKVIDSTQALLKLPAIASLGFSVLTSIGAYAWPVLKPIMETVSASVQDLINEFSKNPNSTNINDLINVTNSTLSSNNTFYGAEIPQLNQTEIGLLEGAANPTISSSPDYADALTKLTLLATLAYFMLEQKKTTLAEKEPSEFKKEMGITTALNTLKKGKKNTIKKKALALHKAINNLNTYQKSNNMAEYIGEKGLKSFEKSNLYNISEQRIEKMGEKSLAAYVDEGGKLLKMISTQLEKTQLVHKQTQKINAYNFLANLGTAISPVDIPFTITLIKTALGIGASQVRGNIDKTFINTDKTSIGAGELIKNTVTGVVSGPINMVSSIASGQINKVSSIASRQINKVKGFFSKIW